MNKTILVVDDSSTVRNLVSNMLRENGFDVVEACDGVHALKKLTGKKIHLVVSDFNMPNKDGIAFVGDMKKLPEYKFVPVIMLTTEASDAMKAAGQAAGVKAWMVKPCNLEKLLAGVRKLTMM